MSGLDAVTARIADIESRIASLGAFAPSFGAGTGQPLTDYLRPGTPGTAAGAQGFSAASTQSSAQFASALQSSVSTIAKATQSPQAAVEAAAKPVKATDAGLTPSLAKYRDLFTDATVRHNLPVGLLAAVAQVESGGNPRAVSHAGAQGLMQIMPATARRLGVDPMDPAQAVDGAARLLRDGLNQFRSLELALAAYNAGPGAVKRYGGVPPYAETQAYVRKVTALLGGSAS